jgi:hypothetical protein
LYLNNCHLSAYLFRNPAVTGSTGVRSTLHGKGDANDAAAEPRQQTTTNQEVKTIMTKHSIAKFCMLTAGLLAIPAVSFAGTASSGKESKPIVEKVKESCITGDLGVNVASQYISRGLVFENQGAIIQPYADLYFKLYEGEGFFSKATLNLGIWNSFHSRHTDAGLASRDPKVPNNPGNSTTRGWYEFDFTAGVSLTFLKNFTITPSYFTFLSPNDGFNTFQGLNVKLAYDDTDLLGKFALHPYVQVLWELENKAGNGADEGLYYEVGIAPTLAAGPVTFSFPIAAGFGSNDFYASEGLTYGFSSAGVSAAYALTFVPECLGTWTVTAGATYYHLSTDSGLLTFNENNVRDRDHNEYVFSGGLGIAF